ncbi:hypothetical protein [Pseudescherichia sp.]|uniref:hypothetical protein n=1 Tax=Pseudescherichia sp. TaxID=2055881 RepID=UPI0028A18EFE|nr:hypothetical protein [Pseudescherichia sp.]
MNNIEFFRKHILHDNRRGFTVKINIQQSKKPGFELLGHGINNDGAGYRFYIYPHCVGIRNLATRKRWNAGDLPTITHSTEFGDYCGLMNRPFGSVLVHVARALDVKITLDFTTTPHQEVLAKLMPGDVVREVGHYAKGRGYNKRFMYETIPQELRREYFSTEPDPAVVLLTDDATEALTSLPPMGICIDNGYPQYHESYEGIRYAFR